MVWSYQLVFDCNDHPASLAGFWAVALDYVEPDWPPHVRAIVDAHPEWQLTRGVAQDARGRHPRLVLQLVPEPRPTRTRVRFEITVPGPNLEAELNRLRGLGAVGTEDLMTDPEGNEFTVRLGPENSPRRWSTILIDAVDPGAAVDFWSRALGFERDGTRCHPPTEWTNPLAPSLQFEPAREPKTGKTEFVTRSGLQVLEQEVERRLADVNLKAIRRYDMLDRKLAESESRIMRRLDGLERR